jgi:DNA primase
MGNQINIVEAMGIPPGGNFRGDCPFCLHKNSFSVSRQDGRLKWYCFFASCTAKGDVVYEPSAQEIFMQARSGYRHSSGIRVSGYKIPSAFVNIRESNKCMDFIHMNNSYDAYKLDLCDILYDKSLDRCVFMIKDGIHIKGAVGRALGNFKPKWYMYGSNPYPFICGRGKQGILVEDCPSACVIGAAGFSGVALLGTSVKASYMDILLGIYESLIIALDRDATNKALDIAKELSYYIPTTVKILEKDLKHYTVEGAKEFLK